MTKSELAKAGFLYQLKDYGLARIIKSFDFIVAFVVFIILFQGYLSQAETFKKLSDDGLTNVITIASTIFSIIIASIAIILSFSGSQFVAFIRKSKAFRNILFSFWLCSVTFLAVILLAFVKFVVNIHPGLLIAAFYNAFVIAAFVYAILQTFYVVSSIMKFAHYLDVHDRIRNQD